MSKKFILILIIFILAILIGGGYFYFQNWWAIKQIKIEKGLASDKFPWQDYSQEELAKMYPQIKYVDVPTRTTPEETYAKFREALRTNNLEMAIEQLSEESSRYEENAADLQDAYKEGRFDEIYESYPERISKENMYENISQYYFNYAENSQEKTHFINFIKDANGDWKLDSF